MRLCPKNNEACSGKRLDLVLVLQQITFATANAQFAMAIVVYGKNQTRTPGKRTTELMTGPRCF